MKFFLIKENPSETVRLTRVTNTKPDCQERHQEWPMVLRMPMECNLHVIPRNNALYFLLFSLHITNTKSTLVVNGYSDLRY